MSKIWVNTLVKINQKIKDDRDGTGLGLAICKAILDLHHFKYGVENIENGVRFYFQA